MENVIWGQVNTCYHSPFITTKGSGEVTRMHFRRDRLLLCSLVTMALSMVSPGESHQGATEAGVRQIDNDNKVRYFLAMTEALSTLQTKYFRDSFR